MADRMARIGFRVLGMAFAVPTGIAARKALAASWRATRKDEPPTQTKDPAAPWVETIAWAVASAAAMAVAEVVATKGAALAWQQLTGSPPPAKKVKKRKSD